MHYCTRLSLLAGVLWTVPEHAAQNLSVREKISHDQCILAAQEPRILQFILIRMDDMDDTYHEGTVRLREKYAAWCDQLQHKEYLCARAPNALRKEGICVAQCWLADADYWADRYTEIVRMREVLTSIARYELPVTSVKLTMPQAAHIYDRGQLLQYVSRVQYHTQALAQQALQAAWASLDVSDQAVTRRAQVIDQQRVESVVNSYLA